MYQPQDKVVYGIHGVCVIVGREVRHVDRKDFEYLVLEPIEQPGACYYVPAQVRRLPSFHTEASSNENHRGSNERGGAAVCAIFAGSLFAG